MVNDVTYRWLITLHVRLRETSRIHHKKRRRWRCGATDLLRADGEAGADPWDGDSHGMPSSWAS